MIYLNYDFPMLSVFTIIDFSYFQDREAAMQRGGEQGMAVWKLMADEAELAQGSTRKAPQESPIGCAVSETRSRGNS